MTEGDVHAYLTPFGLSEYLRGEELPASAMAYAVVQGRNILTVGSSGSPKRLRGLMGGAELHNKKALISLCALRFPAVPIRFFASGAPSKPDAKAMEDRMHLALGLRLGVGRARSCVEGATDYAAAMRVLLGDTRGRPDREQDLIELVVKNGDTFCTALGIPRLRPTALAIFGTYYEGGLGQRPRTGIGLGPRPPRPPQTVVAASSPPPDGNAPVGFHRVEHQHFYLHRRDLAALQHPDCQGVWLTIGPQVGKNWVGGQVEVVVPKDNSSAGWQYLMSLSDKAAVRNSDHFSNGKNLPVPLRPYARR